MSIGESDGAIFQTQWDYSLFQAQNYNYGFQPAADPLMTSLPPMENMFTPMPPTYEYEAEMDQPAFGVGVDKPDPTKKVPEADPPAFGNRLAAPPVVGGEKPEDGALTKLIKALQKAEAPSDLAVSAGINDVENVPGDGKGLWDKMRTELDLMTMSDADVLASEKAQVGSSNENYNPFPVRMDYDKFMAEAPRSQNVEDYRPRSTGQEELKEHKGEPLKMLKPQYFHEQTIGIEVDGEHVVIPSVVDGKKVSDEAASEAYKKGQVKALGTFKTQKEADDFAKERSQKQHYRSPLTDRTGYFGKEIASNPSLIRKMAAMVKGEVGLGRDPVKETIQLESAFNRARIRGHTVGEALLDLNESRKGYYARDTYRRAPTAKEMDYFMENIYKPVMAGSDEGTRFLGSPVTGNASQLGFAGRRLAQGLYHSGKWYSGKPGVGEMFVTEKSDAIRLAKLGLPVGTPTELAGASNSYNPPRQSPGHADVWERLQTEPTIAEVIPEETRNAVASLGKAFDGFKSTLSSGGDPKNALAQLTQEISKAQADVLPGFGRKEAPKSSKKVVKRKKVSMVTPNLVHEFLDAGKSTEQSSAY